MKILLTGGTGFIGTHVVKELLARKHALTLIVREPNKIPSYKREPQITLIQGDFTDPMIVKAGLKGQDALIHLALGNIGNAVDTVKNDLVPSIYILETAALMGVKKILSTTTVGVYGDANDKYGENCAAKPVSMYSATKEAAKAFAYAIYKTYGVAVNTIEPALIFGYAAVEGGTINRLEGRFFDIIRLARKNENIKIKKNHGTQFLEASDIAKVYADVIESNKAGRSYLAMGAEYMDWGEVARIVVDYIGSKSRIILGTEGIGVSGVKDAWKNYPADISAIREDFGREFPVREKLTEYLKWLCDTWNE